MIDERMRSEQTAANALPVIDNKQANEILQLARAAIKEYLTTGKLGNYETDDPVLCQKSDVFVTLWTKSEDRGGTTENLRGCVGRIGATLPLSAGIRESAVSAATKDPRFSPLTLPELAKVRIEIAILSPFHALTSLHDIEIGRHGLMIEGHGRRGLLLPKVATRLNLDRGTFYKAVCDKAGLPYSCWPSSAALFTFTTTTIDE